jgi:hypothetical protein
MGHSPQPQAPSTRRLCRRTLDSATGWLRGSVDILGKRPRRPYWLGGGLLGIEERPGSPCTTPFRPAVEVTPTRRLRQLPVTAVVRLLVGAVDEGTAELAVAHLLRAGGLE